MYVFPRNVCISLSLNHIEDVCLRQNNEFKVRHTYLKNPILLGRCFIESFNGSVLHEWEPH